MYTKYFVLFSPIYDPLTFEEAVEEEVWAQAMDEERECIEKNQTWELVDVPKVKELINIKWIYKTKQEADGNVQKHKARMVERGFTQQPDIDFNETFAPVAYMDIVRIVLAIAAQNKWQVHQMDVKSAFLNGYLEEEVVQIPHVSQPVRAPSTPMTPRHGSTQGPSIQVGAQATPKSTPRGQQTSSNISSRSTSTEPAKTRSL